MKFILNTLTSFLLVLLLVVVSSCNHKSSTDTGFEADSSATYIAFPAPEQQLSDWPKRRDVIVQSIAEPDNLHPTNGVSQARDEVNRYLHVALLQTDFKNSAIIPYLAASLPKVSGDHKEVQFVLRTDAKWDDGSPITAADVVFTIKASKCPLTNNPSTRAFFANVADVVADAANPAAFNIRMRKVYIQNVAMWCDYPIIQARQFDPNGVLAKYSCQQFDDSSFVAANHADLKAWADAFNAPANGNDPAAVKGGGQYRLEKWESGQFITLVRKTNWWLLQQDTSSLPDRILFKFNTDAAAQILDFRNQAVDATSTLSTRTLFELRADSNFNRNYFSRFKETYGYTYIALNMRPAAMHRNPALADVKVRRALALLTPVDEMIRVINKGINRRITNPVSPLKKACNPKLTVIPFDVSKAATLLDEAGWKDSDGNGVRDKVVEGKKTELAIELNYLTTQSEWKEMALMIGEGMAKAGVKVNPVGYDYPLWLEKATGHDFDMAMGSWNASMFPEDYGQLWSTGSYTSNGPNFTGFGTAETDALIDSLDASPDEESRRDAEYRMQQKIYDEQPYVFLYALVRRCVIHKRFSGAECYSERPGLRYDILHIATEAKP